MVGLYSRSATSDDYAFNRHQVNSALQKVYGFSLEFGQQFVPLFPLSCSIEVLCEATTTDPCLTLAIGKKISHNVGEFGIGKG
jgi:hypothetical protein